MDLDVNHYKLNFLYLINYLLNPNNNLAKSSDTNLILSMIKHILKMNNNKIFSNFSDILEELIIKLIKHFEVDNNLAILQHF